MTGKVLTVDFRATLAPTWPPPCAPFLRALERAEKRRSVQEADGRTLETLSRNLHHARATERALRRDGLPDDLETRVRAMLAHYAQEGDNPGPEAWLDALAGCPERAAYEACRYWSRTHGYRPEPWQIADTARLFVSAFDLGWQAAESRGADDDFA